MARPGNKDADPLKVALKHPLRRRILKVAARKDRVSPAELAAAVDEPLPNVIYHVRVLTEFGGLSFLGQVPTKSSIRHFYAFSITEPWALAALGLYGASGDD